MTTIAQPTKTGKHMTVRDLCEELGVARSTFYDWRAARKAPPCIKLPNGDLWRKPTSAQRSAPSVARR